MGVISFEGSRRLTGPNFFSSRAGAVLETLGPVRSDTLAAWRRQVRRARAELGWPMRDDLCMRPHARGVSLFIAAPIDQLLTATEVNEWAWQEANQRAETFAPGFPLAGDSMRAFDTLRRLSAQERQPTFLALHQVAVEREWPLLWDDERITLGLGADCVELDARALPPLSSLTDPARMPVALVTGSNGKTTSVRLLAAMLRAQGFVCGYNCTDGFYVDGERKAKGDYSGPAGAREVLRDRRVTAAVLETARGGMLRRGLAYTLADVALCTNISDDHFGEYGVDDLDDLAESKLTVTRGLRRGGTLVLNADDELLCRHGVDLGADWFAFDREHPILVRARAQGAMTAAMVDERIVLDAGDQRIDLGLVTAMPLTLDGLARYNIANILGAALAAFRLHVSADSLRRVLHEFGASREDNPGRLQRYRIGGADVLTDYAHNPDGLTKLLGVAQSLRGSGRLCLLLGQAGNRDNAEILALADAALAFHPDFIVLKDLQGYMRGRAFGEIPELLREYLLESGYPATQISVRSAELDAVKFCLEWARPGDVLVLPVHASTAQEAVANLLAGLSSN